MAKAKTLFIVEGESRDYRFVKAMTDCFMQGRYEIEVVRIPAAQNIYMLYERLEQDNFETDIVEVLRECVPAAREQLGDIPRRNIAEVYLFFDYDPHQDNLSGVVFDRRNSDEAMSRMLGVFDNETEQGKLYVNYPMVEALYDYQPGLCQAYSRCYVQRGVVGRYKRLAGEGNPISSAHMEAREWKDAIEVFALRVKCLIELKTLSYEEYRESVSPVTIFEAERLLNENEQCVFVLSAFPEFLLDYFGRSFWNSRVKLKQFKFDMCEKGGNIGTR